jgi:hypothetical protein
MILLDVIDVIDELKGEQRELVLVALLNELTSYSHEAILEFQLEYDGSRSFEDFIQGQNELIKECVEIELTFFGRVLRKKEGLDPLSLRTEIYL